MPAETNVDHQELRDEMRLTEPQLFKTETEFPEEYLVPALKKETDSMKKFDVYMTKFHCLSARLTRSMVHCQLNGSRLGKRLTLSEHE